MSKKQRELALEATRDFLKLNGAGAIAVFAIAPSLGDVNFVITVGGVFFSIGLLHSLWTIWRVTQTAKINEAEQDSLDIDIKFNAICFAAAVIVCTIGTIATSFDRKIGATSSIDLAAEMERPN